ncbi:hypothetical protein CYMTET_43528 [Cymbomonas tetramitiformis]|uniref:Uncharacterized protein n=1 Tax=Cymbomonas tetramitiformis TaxID=36881 RepID=A0AAE0C203_9CHLO|nr:hypothetical protein CYMTET_43528 [Cymbomonas tetramitiformis]
MSTERQRARMAAVQAALGTLQVHRRDSTTGYSVVVSGGAHAPNAKLKSIAFAIVNPSFDFYELAPRHPQLCPPPCAPLGRCLVVACGGAAAPIASILLSDFAIMCGEDPHRVFCLTSIATPALVVPGRVRSCHRVGIG